MKNVLNEDQYTHFMSLSIAMRIMLDSNGETRNNYLNYAHELLVYFVSRSNEFYDSFVVYNVNNLIHLKSDSVTHGCSLGGISAFPFEDYLQVVKKFVRKSQSPLSQIAKRISELEYFQVNDRTHTTHKVKYFSNKRDVLFLTKSGDFSDGLSTVS